VRNGWVNGFLARHLDDVVWVLAIALLALIVALVLRHSLRRRFGVTPQAVDVLRRAHVALFSLIVVTAIRLILIRISLGDDGWDDLLAHLVSIAFTATCVWLACEVIIAIEGLLLARFVDRHDIADARVRKLNTQVRLISHLAVTGVIVVGVGASLMSIPEVRIIGTSLLASAGIVSVIAGMAAKTALSNLFAGLQLALSDAVRVGDIIQVGTDSGTVDEITLTYVVVDLWDERRLVIPSDYFIANEFQNWTRKGNEISAVVTADVDLSVPVAPLEAAVRAAVEASTLWDRRSFKFRISAISGSTVTVRMVISTSSVPNMFSLEALVNTTIASFLTGQLAGQGLPGSASNGTTPAGQPAGVVASASPLSPA
jgi:small-conductance mechanosensitive channel